MVLSNPRGPSPPGGGKPALRPAKPARPLPPRIAGPGDLAPRFTLPLANGETLDLHADSIAGRYLVLVFEPATLVAADRAPFRALAERFAAREAQVIALRAALTPADASEPYRVVLDAEGKLTAAYGASAGLHTVVVAPWQHILVHIAEGDPAAQAAAAEAEILRDRTRWDKVDAETATPVHPPVLMIPRVLQPAERQRMIGIYQTDGNVVLDSGHARPGVKLPDHDYKMQIPDYGRVDRIDHWIKNEKTNAWIDSIIRTRVFPEIRKAFHYRITRRELYRVGRYEGRRGGIHQGHRDNTEPHVAHRRFAMTLNLNDDYDGGYLTFPEFGPHRYRPAAGDAIVFSSSVYHEPHEVTRGVRYVLFAFLFGDS